MTQQAPWEGKGHTPAIPPHTASGQNPRAFMSVMAPFPPLPTEQVSTPEIQVLNGTWENGNCSLMLACTVAQGDHVAYSWSQGAGAHPLSVANSSHLLHVTLGPQHADSVYNCTASNPISTRSGSIVPWSSCGSPSPGECRIQDTGSAPALGPWPCCPGTALSLVTALYIFLMVNTSLLCALRECSVPEDKVASPCSGHS